MSRIGGTAAVLVGLVIFVLAASNVDGTPASFSTDVSVELLQYRRDEADRRIEVKVDNGGEDSLHVARAQVLAPRLEPPAPVDLNAGVPAGQRVDLRVPYGEPVCHAPPAQGEQVSVRLWLGSDDDPTELVPKAGSDLLSRILERECAVRRVVTATPLAWSSTWISAGPGVLDGSLLVGPVAAGNTVTVLGVEGTTLFDATTKALPLVLRVGESASIAVRLAPQRCDPHAVAESKRGFDFAVRVAVEGAQGTAPEGLLVTVPLQGTGRDLAEKALLETCGLG